MSSDEDEEEKLKGEGEGIEIYPYGEYEGARDDQLERHGFGSALLPNGDIYEGYYLHGKRHGKGMYCFKNGARYTGNWRKGLKHGQGIFLYPDGSKYDGEWRKDFKHGHGTYYYINGDTYEGPWWKGFRHGLGTYLFKEFNVTHVGTWRDGRMEGPGIYNYPYYKYHGSFEKNLPKGPGCFVFDGKIMQHGFYVNIRDPAFDYVGAEELALEGTKEPDAVEDRSNPRGIVPIWRARNVTCFTSEMLPPEPVALPVKDSEESFIDIIDYLQQQYKEDKRYMEEEHAPPASPVPPELLIDEDLEDVDVSNLVQNALEDQKPPT